LEAADIARGCCSWPHAGEAEPVRIEKGRYTAGRSYPWTVKMAIGLVNHRYLYAVDAGFGPFFLEFCSYFPYNAKGPQRQTSGQAAGRAGGDRVHGARQCLRGVRRPADVDRVQAICDSLGRAQSDALLREWLVRVPHPFPRSPG
jgi:hypothetical protein